MRSFPQREDLIGSFVFEILSFRQKTLCKKRCYIQYSKPNFSGCRKKEVTLPKMCQHQIVLILDESM